MSDYGLIINANENEGNIQTFDDQGNKMLWDENHLRFFNGDFPDIPFWYNKRIAYGMAEHNEYVDLGGDWERTPNIHLAIANFPVFKKDYDGSGQVIDVGIEDESIDGFRVRARLNALSSERFHEYPSGTNVERDIDGTSTAWAPETNNNCTRIVFNGSVYFYNSYSDTAYVTWRVLLYEDNGGTWDYVGILFEDWDDTENGYGRDYDISRDSQVEIGSLPPNKYRLKMEISISNSYMNEAYGYVLLDDATEYYESESQIATGEVTWIAVENSN